jgi:hypothetical protein
MKIYEVEIRTIAIVVADNVADAHQVAFWERGSIIAEAVNVDIEVKELENLTELRKGWHGECIPYGGDGNTRLHDLLLISEM